MKLAALFLGLFCLVYAISTPGDQLFAALLGGVLVVLGLSKSSNRRS